MAFILRCKGPSDVFTLDELSKTSTLKSLKLRIEELTGINTRLLKILHGYPPKPLPSFVDESVLDDLGIKSGDLLLIDILSENTLAEDVKTAKSSISTPVIDSGRGTMIRKPVKANNSCLFSSLYFLLLDSKDIDYEQCEMLRKICAEAVSKDPTKYTTAFLGKPNEEYCEWIRNRNNWGGGIELEILSEHFGVEIVVINTMNEQPHKFGEGKSYSNRVYLIYDGIHYEPLILQLGDIIQTLFQTDDSDAYDLAMSIGIDAKERRQFTDVANFSLKCQICHQLFIGENKALEHAKATGHDSFGEV